MSSKNKPNKNRSSRRMSILRQLWPFLRPYRKQVFAALALLIVGSATILVVPLAFRDLIDIGFSEQIKVDGGLLGEASLNTHFIFLFVLAAFWGLVISLRYYIITWVGERVTADLRSAVYAKVVQQSPQFFETLQTGEVLSRLTGDTTLVQTVVGSSISMGLRSVVQFFGGMVMLAVTSFYLFALNLGLMALLMLPILVIGRKVKALSRESQDKIADASALAGEKLNAIPTIQAFVQESKEISYFTQRAETSFNAAIRRTRVRAALTALIITAVVGAIIFVLWIGAMQVHEGGMSGGELASFILYAVLVAGSVGTISQVWGDVMRAAGATERLLELLSTESPIRDPLEPKSSTLTQPAELQLERVGFHYPSRSEIAALDDVNLTIVPGETVALVGPSGAGKTTLFQLLLRFYDLSSGTIKLNGVAVNELSLHDLRQTIAIVPQESVIFSASALENIRYGRLDANDEEVKQAASAAHADEFINQLPQGYDTFLGERGTRLSGGQRQRIAIARAILKDAPLLLLDEATSALDTESERLVQQGLNTAMQGRTTLIIAHRLSTVQKADRIVVLERGRIVETGTPDDLRQRGGLYAKLAKLQFEV